MKAVILYSGGMDSTVLLNQFKNNIVQAVSFNYGSKHNDKELQYAKLNCKHLGIQQHTIHLDLSYLKSDLLKTGGDIPHGHYEHESMKKTVVPFRNGIMLSIVAGIADSYECDTILIASHKGDHAIYPDCRVSFTKSMAMAIQRGTYNNVKLLQPYGKMTKRAIAVNGRNMGIDFSNTWSCYKGEDIHCGKCGTCIERKEALQGFDTTIYSP